MEQNIECVKGCVQKNHTYRQITPNFKRKFPEVIRGFSESNIRLFCLNNGIKKLDNFQVGNIIQPSVSDVLYSMNNHLHEPFVNMQPRSQAAVFNYTRVNIAVVYGRIYINRKGHCLSSRQVRASFQRVNQVDHNRRRQDIVRRQNHVPYNVPYHIYGNKLHGDQIELQPSLNA